MPPGGEEEDVKLSDVRWGVIFRMGWKMVSYCKYLALIYCLMTLLQNGMNLGVSQLMGKITQELTRSAEVAAPADSASVAATPSLAPASPGGTAENGPLSPDLDLRSVGDLRPGCAQSGYPVSRHLDQA